jgi:hypothetical protein
MTAFSFISISIIEYIGVIVAMLAVFRYPVSEYWSQILFTSLVCSVLSYLLSVQNDISTAPLIQLAALALCVWLMFNTPLLWSMIMCVSFGTVYAVFQGGIVYLMFWFGLVAPIVHNTNITMYLIQLFCAAVCLFLGYYWLRNRIGFLFIPTSRDVRFVWSKNGRLLFGGSIVSFISFGIVYVIYTNTHFQWFFILLVALLIVSCSLLFMMKRKNYEYVEEPWTR